MAQEIISLVATVLANAADQLIGEFTVSDKEKVTVLELGFEFTAGGRIDGFIRQRRIDSVDEFIFPDENHRVVKSIPMVGGDRYSFFGTDTSGAPNVMGVLLVVDRVIEGF